MKTFLAIIGGYVILSGFFAITDWLIIYAGNILGPLMLIGIAVFSFWFFRTIIRNFPNE